MLDKSEKTILWLSLALLGILSPMGLMAEDRWQPYQEGEQKNRYVTTKFVNNTKNNKLWLQTEAVSTHEGIAGLYTYYPVGAMWVNPGESREDRSENYAPEGNAYIYFTEDENPGATTRAPWQKIILNGKSGQYAFNNIFKVDVIAEPIKIYYTGQTPEGPNTTPSESRTGKTYLFYNYTITVSDV